MIERENHLDSPPSQPLDSYFFEVQYTFCNRVTSEVIDQVSTVIESATWDDTWGDSAMGIGLSFKRDRIAEHLTAYADYRLRDNTYTRVCVRIFERSTGRQAILYHRSHSSNAFTHSNFILANFIGFPRVHHCVEMKLSSCLSVGFDGSENNIQMGIKFCIEIRLDDDDNSIDEGTRNLSRTQVLNILQNKLAWK
mmetsp:Transcript_17913/g.51346  ORF Transcript_17913/g.51346 Transcript_17913/m.51346 type:complete len:195 (+) Transcript_17913:3-587(+)